MTLNLDKTTWKGVAFGDVVANRNVTVKSPASAGIERVVAMEHLDPGELKITRWGTLEDGTTFTRRVRPGQTLFGKRRAYQRKAAYSEFDAICSSDILVFEADKDLMLPEFLPFLVQSSGFYDHALGTSAGSLSPRTNWRDLANYEFDLPPLGEQRRIADLLWAVERERNTGRSLLNAVDAAIGAWSDELFGSALESEREIGELVGLCQYGLSVRAGETGEYPMLRMTNLDSGTVTGIDLKYCDLSARDFEAYRLRDGDVLFNRTNSAELVGRSGIFRLDGDFVFASYLVRLRTRPDELMPDYLNEFINSQTGQSRIRVHVSRGVSQANISASKLRKVKIPLVPIARQREIVECLNRLRDWRSGVADRLISATALALQLRAEIFGDAA